MILPQGALSIILVASFTPVPTFNSFSHLLVAGLASSVPHVLIWLNVTYDGIQTEENRLQNKTGQIETATKMQFTHSKWE